MAIVVGVRFKSSGKSYYFDPAEFETDKGESVIVETARGVEIGEITMERTDVPESEIVPPLKKILRIATEEDKEHARENREKEKWAVSVCEEKIAQHNLEMKLIDVEYTFDNNKILFYFTSDGRVDFRELVKDLASIFKTRIELRQIGVRDEAKILGGIGICGRCLCCKSFLGDFHPVSIKMAKEQGMSLNPTKISGNCGRLMCCLKYEQDAYEHLLAKTPNVGAIVDTDRGRGVVMNVSLLKGMLKVRLDNGNESDLVDFTVEEVRLVKNPARRAREKISAEGAAGFGDGAGRTADAGLGESADGDGLNVGGDDGAGVNDDGEEAAGMTTGGAGIDGNADGVNIGGDGGAGVGESSDGDGGADVNDDGDEAAGLTTGDGGAEIDGIADGNGLKIGEGGGDSILGENADEDGVSGVNDDGEEAAGLTIGDGDAEIDGIADDNGLKIDEGGDDSGILESEMNKKSTIAPERENNAAAEDAEAVGTASIEL